MSFPNNLIQADKLRRCARIVVCILCSSYCILPKASAQNHSLSYTVLHYNNDNSLVQNSTWAVAFDRQGYGWIGMEDGIARYDGKNFMVFNKKNIPGIRSSIFTSVIADKRGSLYGRDDLGSRIKINPDDSRGAHPEADSSHVLISRKGWLYKGERYKILLAQFCDSNKLKAFEDNRQFIAINDSTIYFYDTSHLWYLCGNTIQGLRMNSPMDVADGVLLNVSLLGDALISVHRNNSVEYFYKGQVINSITHIDGVIASDTCFIQGNFRVLWCRNGSFIYTNGKLYNIFVKDNTLQSQLLFTNLPATSPVGIYYHPQLNLYFLPTNNDGLFIIKPTRFKNFTAPGDSHYNNTYYNIANMPGNRIAANNLLFDSVGNTYPFYLAESRLKLMYNEGDKGMWYSYQDFLKYYSFGLKKNTVELKYKKAVFSYCVSRYDSALYFSSGFTIFKLAKNSTEEQYILNGNAAFTTSEGNIPRNKITSFGEYAAGQFILGTYNGLYSLNAHTGKITKLAGGMQILKIYCDAQGNAWIGTLGNDFYCYSRASLTSFQPRYRQTINSFYEFLEDDHGGIWISTNNGLILAKKKNLLDYCRDKNTYVHYDFFDNTDGFATNEFNGGSTNCAVKLHDGRLVFASMKGLVSFYPAAFANFSSHSSIYIDDIIIDSTHLSSFQRISVPASFSTLSFAVSSPQFTNTSDNSIKYSVRGLNDTWEALPDNGIITFNKLPHGSYTLRLRKGNGTSGYIYTKTLFVVKAYFYQTVWFKILTVILLFLAIYFLVQLRLRMLYTQKKKLETLVSVRTGELNQNISMLQNTIRELETSEEKIYQNSRFKEKLISIILHDLRSPLRFLSSVSNNLATEYKNMPDDAVKQNLDSLSTESTNVYQFTKEFLTWIYTQQSDYMITKKAVDIDSIFTNVQNLYHKIAEQNNNIIQVKLSQTSCFTDESILKIIIRNLVDNATKYTRNGTVQLDTQKEENNIVIRITDDGTGMHEAVLLRLEENETNRENGEEKTLGIMLANELVKKLNGTLQFISNQPAGTIVEIRLPA